MGELTPEIMHSIHPSRAGEGGEGCFLRDYRGAFNETTSRNVRSQRSRDGGAFHASVVSSRRRRRRCTLIGDRSDRSACFARPRRLSLRLAVPNRSREPNPDSAFAHTPPTLTDQPTRDPPRLAPRRSSACITLARFFSRDATHVRATARRAD